MPDSNGSFDPSVSRDPADRVPALRGAARADRAIVRAFFALLVAWLGSSLLTGPVVAQSSNAEADQELRDGQVPRIRVEGPLDMGGLALLQRALRAARETGVEKLILELDTPGGQLETMWQYSKALTSAQDDGLTVIAWVDRQALSAGALLALSCERLHMRVDGVIGAAQPILSTPFGPAPIPDEGGIREKLSSSMRAEFRAVAERYGRSGALAEAMVDPDIEVRSIRELGGTRLITGEEWDNLNMAGKRPEFEMVCPRGQLLTLTGREALALGMCDGIADDLTRLLEDNGLYGRETVRLERRPSEVLLGRLNEFSFLLLAAGLLLAYIELKVPGFGLPGILSVACFLLLLVGRHMVGLADIPEIVFAVIGMGLVGIELFLMPGTIWFGLVGGVMLAFAVISSALGPNFAFDSALDRELLMNSTSNFILTALSTLALMWALARFLPETPLLKRLALGSGGSVPGEVTPESFGEANPLPVGADAAVVRVGALGTVRSTLRPVGTVLLDGAGEVPFEASSSGPAVERGARVQVTEVHTSRLVVEMIDEGPATPRATSPTEGPA